MNVHRREQMNKGGRILKNNKVCEWKTFLHWNEKGGKQSNDKKNMVEEKIIEKHAKDWVAKLETIEDKCLLQNIGQGKTSM